jgi:chemotaxis protein MotB
MNETRQPFTDHVTQAGRVSNAKLGWIITIITALLLIVSVWFWSSSAAQRAKVESARAELKNTATDLSSARAENQANAQQIADLKSQLAELEKEREMATQKAETLEDQMRADLESKDVAISKLQGKLTVTILDQIMFDSGEAVLKPGGESVMEKIATFLTEHPELKIHVIGHTDNIPIRPEAHSRFASNWELSTARALAALHFLTEKAGVDPRRVGAVGYGEYRPIADNTTAEGRARNRRIAITILPDELVGTGAAATVPSTALP